MTNKVLLNNVDHADLRVALRHGAEFGDSANQMLVFPTEFEELEREHPILFRKGADGAFQAVVLLGFDRDENLSLAGDGWRTRSVPAVQRRGPFSIRVQEREVDGEPRPEPMVLVDLDDPRVGADGGLPVFLPHGGNAPLLEQVTGALRTIHAGQLLARPMFDAFAALDLIEPVRLEISLADDERYLIPDRYTIGAERLAALKGAELEALHKAGFLKAAFDVRSSLGNVGRLIELRNRRRARG